MCSQVSETTVGREQPRTDSCRLSCKVKCCFSCSYCNRASTKERYKSRVGSCKSERMSIKTCQRCFFCHSVVLCQSCSKCPSCCIKSTCRGQISKLLGGVAGPKCQSKGGPNLERGLHPPLPGPTKTLKISHSHKLLCQSPQEQLPAGGIASDYRQKCSRTGTKPNFTGIFQPTFFSTQAKQQMEAHSGFEQSESLSQNREIQMETPETIRTSLQQGEWVTSLDFKDAYFHIPIQEKSRKYLRFHVQGQTYQFKALPFGLSTISKISCPGSDIPIQSTAFRSVHSAHGVHCGSKRGEANGHTPGYRNPPVPRRLVGESQIPPGVSPAYSDPSEALSNTRLAGKFRKVGTGTKTGLRLCRLPVRSQVRPGQTDTGPVAKSSGQNSNSFVTTGLSGPAVHVPDRSANSHRETSSPRPVTHEAHTVASQKQLEGTRILREDYPSTEVPTPTLAMVVRGKQCAPRSTFTPNETRSANIYRRIKRRVGRSLKRVHCKRILVGSGKQNAHKLFGTQSGVSSLKRVPKSLCRKNSSSSNRQHYGGRLHKQGRGYEVGPTVCPTLENLDLVFPETSNSKGPTHPRPSKCDSGQTVETGADHSNGMVSPPRSLSGTMHQVAPAPNRPVCHEVQSQVTPVCVSSSGFQGGSSGCTHSAM